ncbi:MAG TPA: hypothetical protein VJW73_02820 [Gemmatimonadaceae bacterium]|nr:hypothetical protein [Gemmatimonadaceae bacterium]
MRKLLRPVAWLVFRGTRVFYRVWLRYAQFEDVEGLRIVDLARGDVRARRALLKQAARLINTVQPYRLQQIRRYLRHIVVSPTGGSGEYWYGLGVCVLDPDYLGVSDAIATAMLLIHESAHGRLDRWRIRTTPRNADRVEQLCVAAEVAFAARVPGGEAHSERVRRSLHDRWWSQERQRDRQRRRIAQLRVPKWVMSLYDYVMGHPHLHEK